MPQTLKVMAAMCACAAAPGVGMAQVATVPAMHAGGVPTTTIVEIAPGAAVLPETVTGETVRVFGRWTGAVDVEFMFLANGIILLVPERAFTAGDTVTVTISGSVLVEGGEPLAPGGHIFSFTTVAGEAMMEFEEIETYSPDESFVRIYGGQASDLDADGWMDLSIVNENSDDVRVYMNNADGTGMLTGPVAPFAPVGETPSPNEPADFNGDGHVDIAVANTQDTTISVLLGNGDGTFQAASHYESGFGGRGLAVLDVEGDGDTDIAATASGSSHMRLFLNDGSGVFTPQPVMDLGVQERALTAADMNNDGHTDLIVSLFDAQQIVVLANDGDGTFTALPPEPAGGTVWMVVAGDVNGDGNIDLSTANGGSGTGSILLGDGAGGLGTPQVRAAGGFCTATDLGDLDGDGDADWVLSSFGGGQWRVFENNGAGVFALKTVIPAESNPGCSLMADMDNDTDLDLILLDELADLVHIMGNIDVPTVGCPADLDGDGMVGSADLNVVLGAFGASGAGDVDGDGDTDSGDLNVLLAGFGRSCR